MNESKLDPKKFIHHEPNEEKSWKKRLIESLREIVFGLEDGIVSTLGAVTGIAIGSGDPYIVLLAGIVIIFVESLSMSAGTFLSNKSEYEVEQRMLAEERYEIEHEPEKERAELVEFYEERGFTPEEVEMIVNRVTQNPDLWLEEMAHKELGITLHEKPSPYKDALIMGISYIVGGSFVVVSYIFLPIETAIFTSLGLSVVVLFIIGFVKGRLVHIHPVRSGLEMVLVSLTAAGVGYAVGRIVSNYFGVDV